MAELKPLIETGELQWHKLEHLMAHAIGPKYVNLDQELDEWVMLYIDPGAATFVHYLDGDVALICTVEDLAVVGFQIEGFTRSFLPKHKKVAQELVRATRDELAEANVHMLIPAFT